MDIAPETEIPMFQEGGGCMNSQGPWGGGNEDRKGNVRRSKRECMRIKMGLYGDPCSMYMPKRKK